jgi:hypothetical protein
MKSIEVIVEPGGGLRIEALGFSGPDCEKATEYLEKALGQVTGKRRKPEYHARRQVTRQVRT